MDQLNTTTFTPDRERGQHLKFEDRCSIKIFKKLGYSLRSIAAELNCSPSTVMYELRRGTGERNGSRGRFPEYSAKRGQANYEINRSRCHKHHKLVDTLPKKYNVDWLKEIKHQHELQGIVDISPAQAQSARLMLAEMADVIPHRIYNNSSHFEAGANAVQNITINKISGRGRKSIPSIPTSGTIGSDPSKRSYVKHLYTRLVDFKSKIPKYDMVKAGSIVARNVTKLFRATWSNVPLSRYDAFVAYLQAEIDKTPIGRKNTAKGTKNYSSYDEFMNKQ